MTTLPRTKANKSPSFFQRAGAQWQLMLMSIPFFALCLLFQYAPLTGWVMAFQKYKPGIPGYWNQQWVGFDNFYRLFFVDDFSRVLRNTIVMSVLNMGVGTIAAILLALMMNEVRGKMFKRSIQTISYLPHFLSWVVVAGIVTTMLSYNGPFNKILVALGVIQTPQVWLSQGNSFWTIICLTNVWKEVGWNTIIYLSAMSAIDPALYEAASVDGAGRFRKIWHITLQGIKPTIIILLIMNAGHILDAGFEQQYLLQNGYTMDFAETIDIYVLKWGITKTNYSLGTAAGIFKSTVSIILLLAVNTLAKRFNQERVL